MKSPVSSSPASSKNQVVESNKSPNSQATGSTLISEEEALLGTVEQLFISPPRPVKEKPKLPRYYFEKEEEEKEDEDDEFAEKEGDGNELDENAPTVAEVLTDLNELRLFLKYSQKLHQSFIPQLNALTPLVYRPDISSPLWRNTGEPVVKSIAPKMNEKVAIVAGGLSGFAVKIVTSYIPGFFGFSQSPILLRPLKSVESGIQNTVSVAKGTWAGVSKEQGRLTTTVSAADASRDVRSSVDKWFLLRAGYSALQQHYQWNPREARVKQFAGSLQESANHLHYLVVRSISYTNKYGKIELPYPQSFSIRDSAAVNDLIYATAAVKSIKDEDYSLMLDSFKAAGSFKIFKDLNTFGGRSYYSALELGHLAVGALTVAPVVFDVSKNLMELHKHRKFLTTPYALFNDFMGEMQKNSAPWTSENYQVRVDAYRYLRKSLLGEGGEHSVFEQKLQNLFYNLTLSGEALGAASQLTSYRISYAIGHLMYGLMHKMDGYDWYPHFFEQVCGDLQISADPSRNKIFQHFFNRLIWAELIIPLGVHLPLRGINTAVLRALAEKMFNNDEFIFKLRLQMDRLLKSILINPSELAKFEYFEFPETDKENTVEEAAAKTLTTVQAVEVGAETLVSASSFFNISSFFSRQESRFETVCRVAKALNNYNPRDAFIEYMSACPIKTGRELSYEEMLSEQPKEASVPLAPFDALLEKALDKLDFKGLTLAKKGKSYIETLVSPITYPLTTLANWAWDEWHNNPQALLARIQKASSLTELPEFAELEELLGDYATDESYTSVALCHDEQELAAFIQPFKAAYDAKVLELRRKTSEARKATHTLFARYEELHVSLKTAPTTEVSRQLRDKLALFERDVVATIAQYQGYPDASYYASLSSETPRELKIMLALRDASHFKSLCFNVFVEHLNNSGTGSVDDLSLLAALVAEKDASESELVEKMHKDLELLDKEDVAAKAFVAASSEFLNTILSLHKEFVSAKNNNTLNATTYKQLKAAFKETSMRLKDLSAPLKGEFFAAVAEGFTLSLAKFQEEIALIEKDLGLLQAELEPIKQLFTKMQGRELSSLPSLSELVIYRSLIKQSRLSSQYQLMLDGEREKLLADKNEEAFKQVLLAQLDAVSESFVLKVGEQLARKPQKGVQIINEQTAAFFAALEPLKKHFADDVELGQKIAQFNARVMELHRQVLINELNDYLALVDEASDLPRKSRLTGAVSPFSYAQIVRIVEFLEPHLPYHEDACKAVVKQLGLPLGQEKTLDLKQLLLAHTQKQLFSLLNMKLAKVSLSGKDNLATLCSMQEPLLTPELTDFFNGDKELLRKHISCYFEALMPTLVENYLVKEEEYIKEQRKLLNSGRRNIPMFAKKSLTQEEYDQELRTVLAKLDSFEPQEYRAMAIERIKAFAEKLSPVSFEAAKNSGLAMSS